MAHKVMAIFLVFTITTAVFSVGIYGMGYYLTPVQERPLRTDYVRMKPSGSYSHGLGILGAAMLVVGVSTYSSRKRIRALWNLGKLSQWLEFHIFLCLLGPSSFLSTSGVPSTEPSSTTTISEASLVAFTRFRISSILSTSLNTGMTTDSFMVL